MKKSRSFIYLAALLVSFLAPLTVYATAVQAGHEGGGGSVGGGDPTTSLFLVGGGKKSFCDLFTQHPSQPGLAANWNREASGFDLLSDLAFVRQAQYRLSLGIIDSGLLIRGNAAAGTKLTQTSPEQDFELHGTHVAGIAASEQYGVNPLINMVMFATQLSYDGLSSTKSPKQVVFDNIAASVSKAARDPRVDIVNLSLVLPTEAETDAVSYAKAVESLVRNNPTKWVVFAAGNEGAINSSWNNAKIALSRYDNFFDIGSISYLASPSSFTNFGSNIAIFAPGSEILSLNARYSIKNPALEPPAISMSGTSMASPAVAALLETMRAINPELSARAAKLILRKTALERGHERAIAQLNGYLAVLVTAESRDCLKNATNIEACIDSARSRIQDAARAPRLKGDESSCGSASAYYRELRKYYFITQASSESAQRLQDYLNQHAPSNWMTRFYFSAAHADLAIEYDRIAHMPFMNHLEAESAEFFAKGHYREAESAENAELKRLAHSIAPRLKTLAPSSREVEMLNAMLSKLAATPENVDVFWEVCRDNFFEPHFNLDSSGPSGKPAWSVNAYASLRCSKFFTNAPVSFQKTIAEKMIANERTIRDGAFAEAIPQTALASQYPRLAERLLVDYAVAELPRVAESPYETDDQQRAYRAENLVRSKPFYSEAAIDALVVALTSAIEHYPSLHELKYLSRYVYCDLVAKASPSLLSRYRKSLREGFHARAGDNFKQSSNYERAQAEYFEANEELFFELTIDEHRSEQGLTVVDSEVITRLGSLASACLAEPIPCAYEDHFKYITGFSFVDWFTSERARGVLLRAAIKNPKILAMVVQIAGYRKETLQDFNSEALRSGVEADFLKALQVAVAMVPAAQNGSDYVGYLVSRFVYDQRATKEVGGLYQTIQTDRHSPTSERIRAHLVELEASERRLRGEDLAFLRKNPSILDATQLAAKPEALRALADMLKETSALVAVTDFDLFPDATNAPANFSIAKRMLSELGEVARPHVLLARASVDQKHAYQEIEKLYRPYWNSLLRHQTQFGQTAVSLAPFAVELFPQEGFEPFFEGVIRALLIEPSQVRVAPGSEAGSDRVIYELGRTWMTQAFFTLENSEHGQAYLLGHPKLRDAVANQILAGNLDIKLQTWVQPAADGSVTSFLSDAMFEALKVRLPSDKSAYLNSLHFESRLGWYSEDLGEPLTGQWVLAMLNDKRFEDMNLTLEFVAEFNRLAPGKLIQLTQAPVGEKAIWYGNGLLARAFQSSLARMIATATRQKNSAKLKMYRTLLKQHELELRLQNYVNACDEALRAIARSR